jgi:hypothetical protein
MKKIFLILISFAFLTACERKIDEFAPNANGVNFSKFVAIGNSLTAGYADGALYTGIKIGQDASIANIIAQQLGTVGNQGFTQPLMPTADGVGVTMTPAGPYFTTKMVLKFVQAKNCDGTLVPGSYSMKPALLNPAADQLTLAGQLMAPSSVAAPYNNMAVPGATLQSLFFPGYGSALGNPFFARFASNPLATVMEDALAQQPTFFYLWIGNNDVLGSALAGTDAFMTPVDTFAKYYNIAVGALVGTGTNPKGVVGNIPDITTAPFFNTVPWNSLFFVRQGQADSASLLYTLYGHPEIKFNQGYNGWVYLNGAGEMKQMTANDRLLLNVPQDSMRCYGMGVGNPYTFAPYPFPNKYVLDAGEAANITARVNSFNSIIRNASTTFNVAMCDMNSNMKYLNSVEGLFYDGINFNLQFVSGGTFSTDGLHLCPRGNAIAANYFIQAINAKYGCTIPEAIITDYPGLVFPDLPTGK